MVLNIVKNAIKFTNRGCIKIRAKYDRQTENLIVYVSDTGSGIASEDFTKLFSRYGKLHRTAENNHEGIGMGLTIVKQIVEKSGG